MRCNPSIAFVLCLLSAHLAGAAAGKEIEAGELVKLARNHRLSCRQGTATYSVKFNWLEAGEIVKDDFETIEVSWDANNIIRKSLGRQTEESGIRMAIIRDGQLLEYSRFIGRALISDRSREYSDLFFDPRSLGATTRTVASESLRIQLFPDDAGTAIACGDDSVEGINCLQVQWIRTGLNGKIFIWIEKSSPHRIMRYEASGMRKTNTYKKNLVIPETTTIERMGDDGQLMYRNLYRLIDFTPNVSDSIVFGLADFQMPVGTPVVDLSINETIGYWNGIEPVASYVDAVHSSGLISSETFLQQRRIRPSVFVASGLAIIALLILVYNWRFRRGNAAD